MKFIILLFLFFIAFMLNISNARFHSKEEDDQSGHGHNSSHLDCLDVFIPLINRLANEAKELSDDCVATANAHKERELALIKSSRSELFSEVKRIKDTLTACSSRNDHLGYFECLNGIVETDKKIVEHIASKSSKFSSQIKEIEEQEIKCFRDSVNKVKDKNSYAINNLQYCLTSRSRNIFASNVPQTTSYPKNHDISTSTSDYDDYVYAEPPSWNSLENRT